MQQPDACQTSFQAVLGVVLQQERDRLGLSQAQVASAVGVTQSAWSRIERGVISPSPDQLWLAARRLGTRVEDLVGRAERHLGHLARRGVRLTTGRAASTAAPSSGLKWVAGAALVGLLLFLAAKAE